LRPANAQPVTFDQTFGQNGITTVHQEGIISFFEFDKQGNIIAVSRNEFSNYFNNYIIKTDSNGMLDNNFGTNGVVSLPIFPSAFRLTKDDKILILGKNKDSSILLEQFNSDGSIDSIFGNNGVIVIENTYYGELKGNLDNDDFFLLFGTNWISKYNYNGNKFLDFGINGTKHFFYTLNLYKPYIQVVKALSDQSILFAGTVFSSNPYDRELMLCKIRSDNGDFVSDFADEGIWNINLYKDVNGFACYEIEEATDILEATNGNLFLSSVVTCSPNSHIFNFLPDGTLNRNFGDDGIFAASFYVWYSGHQYILINGNNIITGITPRDDRIGDWLYSVTLDGYLDEGFYNTPNFTLSQPFHFRHFKLQNNNKLILGGSYNEDAFQYKSKMAIARLNIPYNVSVKPYNQTGDSVFLFPNPVKDYLYFNIERKYEIVDIQGRVLYKSEKNVQMVNVSQLKTGIYFIKFDNNQIEKFVKQ
jgi:hypothetical protein